MLSDHREVRVAEDPLHLVRAEHPAKRLLDPLFDLPDLAPEGRELAARGVDDLSAAVEARLDGADNSGELADSLLQAPTPRELITDGPEPLIEIGNGAERFDDFGELFGLEHRPNLRAANVRPDVVEAAKRRRQPAGKRLGHFGRQRLPAA